jgi:hypothetical protein
MASPLVTTGDLAVFPANSFTAPAPALTDEISVAITGTGKLKVRGKAVCVLGDEASVVVPACAYATSSFTIKGVGSLKISAVLPAQQSQVAKSTSKAALLAAAEFITELTVATPASVVSGGVTLTDTVAVYVGTGRFQSQNTVARTSR